MKNVILSSAIVISLVALGMGAAYAQGGQRGGPSFAQVDANGDGMVSMAELQGRGQARFAAADTNSDGQLDVAELTAAAARERAGMIERLMARKDTNGDGLLSPEEMAPRDAGRFFAKADLDGSGEVSLEEWETAKAQRRGRHGPQAARNGN